MSYPIHGTYPRFLWEQWVVGTEIEATPLLEPLFKINYQNFSPKKTCWGSCRAPASHRHNNSCARWTGPLRLRFVLFSNVGSLLPL